MDTSGRVALPTAFEDSDIDNLALLIGNLAHVNFGAQSRYLISVTQS